MHRGIDINPFTMSKTRGQAPLTGLRRIRFPITEMPGGASRDRTDDLKLAKLALSQLSYGPSQGPRAGNGGPERI